MMTREYTVKVYADAVEAEMRTLESVPEQYKKEVRQELERRRISAIE